MALDLRERVFSVSAGDLNGDGRVDLIAQAVAGPHAPLLVLLNRG
jgi:hypothetical protein